MNGLDLCERIRLSARKDPLIMMLTAKATEGDRILGYGAGADDYLAKPFNPSELIARVRALLRRTRRLAKLEARPIETSHLLIDLERREVLVRQDTGSDFTAVELSPIEFDLLHKLASRPRVIFTRTQLLDAVRGEDFVGDERVIDTYVKRIRRQLSSPEDRDRYIKTHRGLGYSFEDVST
jgi:DNA-binding response OmpR family regulator